VGPDHGDCALVVGRKKVVGEGDDKSKVNLRGMFCGMPSNDEPRMSPRGYVEKGASVKEYFAGNLTGHRHQLRMVERGGKRRN
jgi:hypothetical protein